MYNCFMALESTTRPPTLIRSRSFGLVLGLDMLLVQAPAQPWQTSAGLLPSDGHVVWVQV